jgi:hypothetical protein
MLLRAWVKQSCPGSAHVKGRSKGVRIAGRYEVRRITESTELNAVPVPPHRRRPDLDEG